jgi:hypothetical protein
MHARMLCIIAPLQRCNEQRSVEAPSKDQQDRPQTHSPTGETVLHKPGAYRLSGRLL